MIVGAGVLGLCTAFALKQRGHAVRVVDPREDAAEPGDRILILGARDDTLTEFGQDLLERL